MIEHNPLRRTLSDAQPVVILALVLLGVALLTAAGGPASPAETAEAQQVVVNETVYVVDDGGVSALDQDTLAEEWTVAKTGALRAELSRDGTQLFVTYDNGSVEALFAGNGTQDWINQNAVSSSLSDLEHITTDLADEHVLVQDNDSIAELNQSDGTVENTYNPTGTPEMLSHANRSNTVYYIDGADRRAYDYGSDSVEWTTSTETMRALDTVAGLNNTASDNLVSAGDSVATLAYVDGSDGSRLNALNSGANGFGVVFDSTRDKFFFSSDQSQGAVKSANVTSTGFDGVATFFNVSTTATQTDLSVSKESRWLFTIDSGALTQWDLSAETSNQTYSLTNATEVVTAAETVNETTETVEQTPESDDPALDIDPEERWLQHGNETNYTVTFTNESGTFDVTDETNVTTNRTDLITIDNSTATITATTNESRSGRAPLNATFSNATATFNDRDYVTVANGTLEDILILPPIVRFQVFLGNDNVLTILVGTLAGIVGARWTNAFGGIGLMTLTVVAGWFAGFTSGGIMLVTVFVGSWLGLNLAANIDYEVQQ